MGWQEASSCPRKAGEAVLMRKWIEMRVGRVLVPTPILLISPRCYRLLLETNTKGFGVDVAHLV